MTAQAQKSSFGKLPDGTAVDLYTLTNANGLIAKITNYGTIIAELHVPDRKGKLGDVVLGFDNLAQYLKGHPCFGCTEKGVGFSTPLHTLAVIKDFTPPTFFTEAFPNKQGLPSGLKSFATGTAGLVIGAAGAYARPMDLRFAA